MENVTDSEHSKPVPLDCALGTWKPIETAPKDGTRIILTDGELISIGCWNNNYGHYCWSNEAEPQPTDGPGAIQGWWENVPTHWMPLPAPPENT